jgi:hypothetical protein
MIFGLSWGLVSHIATYGESAETSHFHVPYRDEAALW